MSPPHNVDELNPMKALAPAAVFIATLTLSVSVSLTRSAQAAEVIHSEDANFQIETIATGLKSPWALVKLPDGRMLVTERDGRLRVISADGKLQEEPVANVPAVVAKGQGGLLDLELHPEYAENGWIYISYSKPGENGAMTSIIRARLKGNALEDIETIFDPPAADYTTGGNHFGNRMEFDGKGYLFFSIGERGDQSNAQLLTNAKGKIHRIRDDGKIPEDNPFVNTPGAIPSIWCYGNRNPQGLRFQPGTGVLWESEHGPRGGDELNIIRKGANYGWPVITYGINYNGTKITDFTEKEGMEQPVIQWTPSIAACGMDFYTGNEFPKWKGNLFVGALAHQKLVRCVIDGEKVTKQEILLERIGRIRDVRSFGDGGIYVVVAEPGSVFKIVPAK